jgi:hypothetical protein
MMDNFAPAQLLGRDVSSHACSGTLVDGTEVVVKRAVRREPGPSQDLSGKFYTEVHSPTPLAYNKLLSCFTTIFISGSLIFFLPM